jgi:PleD family two-component response regulator
MPETNAESLLHRADAALYAAKSKGRDQYSVFAGEDEA